MNASGSAPWIKIITRIFEDPKLIAMEQLPDGAGVQILWFKLLTLAGEQNRGGSVYFTDDIPFTAELLAAKWRCKPALVQFALGVFQKYGMIGIDQEGTLFISNWAKYQNEEGLARIRDRSLLQLNNGTGGVADKSSQRRAAAAERQRKHRQRNREGADGASAVTRDSVTPARVSNVTRDSVTVTPQKENQIKTENKEPPTVPPGGTGKEDLVDLGEAERCFNELFGRNRAWSDDEEELLARLLPISRADFDLIQWGYSLNRDSEGWALIAGDRATKPKHSLIVLLREFNSELDKWRSVKGRPVNPADATPPDDWPAGAREAALELYGAIELPPLFTQLASSARSEIEQNLRQPKLERAG